MTMNQITPEQLLQSGLTLITMPLGSKGPNHSEWNLRHNCIFDSPQLIDIELKNIGIAHAYCQPTPTAAFDIDNYQPAKSWLASHGVDLDALLKASDAVVIWSGKKFSLKLLYRLPIGDQPLVSKKILGPDSKSALEFRCATKDGLTVQDVLPPSIHPDGYQYQWLGEGDPLNPPEIPSEVLSLWRILLTNSSRVATRKHGGIISASKMEETPRRIAKIKSALVCIDADCDYETWRNIVWAILSTGWTCAEDIAYEWSKSAPNCFDEDAFWLVANSFIPDHTSPITAGTIYHFARLGGWNG